MHQLILITAMSATTGLFGGKHCGGKPKHATRAVSASSCAGAASYGTAAPCGASYGAASPCGASYAAPSPAYYGATPAPTYAPSPQAYPSAPPKTAPAAPMAPPAPTPSTPPVAG